jgi:hypothetical protein
MQNFLNSVPRAYFGNKFTFNRVESSIRSRSINQHLTEHWKFFYFGDKVALTQKIRENYNIIQTFAHFFKLMQ